MMKAFIFPLVNIYVCISIYKQITTIEAVVAHKSVSTDGCGFDPHSRE